MNKNSIAIIVAVILIGAAFVIGSENLMKAEINQEEDSKEESKNLEVEKLIDCLEEAEVKIYGSRTCPACTQLANSFGGYEAIESIYVECSEERDRCLEETKTDYVPEIQIAGELYEGSRSHSALASEVNCRID